jgi:hypothetical protein
MDAIGGGVLVAVAATLWIAYLLPSWLRRRQYLATERNAVRLQQTLRILAETSETPGEVRLGMTARDVAAQERILHEHELAARLEAQAAENLAIAERNAAEEAAAAAERELAERAARAEAEAVRAADAAARRSATTPAGITRRGLRRRRATCSLLLLASLLATVVGLVAMPFGGSPLIAAAGAGGMLVAMTALVVLARRRPAPVAVAAPVVARPEAQPFVPIDTLVGEAEEERAEGWTPRPLPKPLHLSRGTIAATAMASIAEAEQLKRTAADAEIAERAERLEPQVPVLRPHAASVVDASGAETSAARSAALATASEASSPYARMGIVDGAEPGISDLDLVLRRRRTAV